MEIPSPEFDHVFDEAFPGKSRDENRQQQLRIHWERPDREFFRAGACHILAHAFLDAYPHSEFQPFLILPTNDQSGYHVFVARHEVAFDYQGYTERSLLVRQFEKTQLLRNSDWRYDLVPLAQPVVTRNFCRQHEHRYFDAYYTDPRPRARKYLTLYPEP